MFFHHHNLTTALHSKLNGSLADQWLKAASQVNIECLAEELRLLDSTEIAARFIELDLHTQRELIPCFTSQEVAGLLVAMRPITRRRVLRMLPLMEFARIFGQLPRLIQIAELANLNSAKQKRFWHMRKRFHQPFQFDSKATQLPIETTVEEATAHYYSNSHHNHYIYVVDGDNTLCGVIHGQMLAAISVKKAPIGLYMEQVKTLITRDHDSSYVATQLYTNRALELPVVDHYHCLIGVVDIDDLG